VRAIGGDERRLAEPPAQPSRRERRIPFPLENPARDSLTGTGAPRHAVRTVTAREDEPVDPVNRTMQWKPVD
jgi:hypothetical protein